MTSGGNGSLNLWKYSYPKARKVKDEDEREKGVAGTVNLINSAVISTQPVGSFDWNSSMVRSRAWPHIVRLPGHLHRCSHPGPFLHTARAMPHHLL